MKLYQCPHMNARCPHFNPIYCNHTTSRQCHYVLSGTASVALAVNMLQNISLPELSYVHENQLENMRLMISEIKDLDSSDYSTDH